MTTLKSPRVCVAEQRKESSKGLLQKPDHDSVNHPNHYTSHPTGIECIDIAEHFSFNIGNAVKYLWRCGLKGNEIEDLRKARWYIEREISKRKKECGNG